MITLLSALMVGGVQFLCTPPNDLLQLVQQIDPSYKCSTLTLDAAVAAANTGDGILSLARGYPNTTTSVSSATMKAIASKQLKVYVEFPDSGPVVMSTLERAVVSSNNSLGSLTAMTLLNVHAIPFVQTKQKVETHLLDFAVVAGYDTAVDGLPTSTYPLLFENSSVLFAAAQLSQFQTMRFSPVSRWSTVFEFILSYTGIQTGGKTLSFKPNVYPAYQKDEVLPANAKSLSLQRAVTWYLRSGMVIDYSRMMEAITQGPSHKNRIFFDLISNTTKLTGRIGVFEGHASTINLQGRQPTGINIRNDCNTETAMAFAGLYRETGDEVMKQISTNILNYIWIHGGFSNPWMPGIGVDAKGETFGLQIWSSGTSVSAAEYYKDDNARALLAGLAVTSWLNDTRWQTQLVTGILSNLRWTGTNGFGANDGFFSKMNDWESVYNSAPSPTYSPHYQSYLWAVYLWGYKASGHQPLYDRAYAAIKIMMDNYPTKWIPTSNGITMQRARMILPLAWLVRVNDTAETRGWLDTVIKGLMTRQQPCGAFMEEISAAGWGGTTRVPNNQNYGTFEAPLNQENTDPVSDMLYTQNFAFVGLHEAAALDSKYKPAADQIGDFLVRIQSRSEVHPDFDGAYFRAFDFKKWEVYASDADVGWGAWSTETGWTQSWISAYLALQVQQTTLWDISTHPDLLSAARMEFDQWIDVFFPQ